MKVCCLSIVEDLENNKILMVQNNRGINKGFFNFPGGKIEKDETIDQGNIRETIEETGITPINTRSLGKVEFQPIDMTIYLFYTDQFNGKIKYDDNENRAFWIDRDRIPFDKMRSTDMIWLKDLLKYKQPINKRVYFNNDFSLNHIEDIYDNIEKFKRRYKQYHSRSNNLLIKINER